MGHPRPSPAPRALAVGAVGFLVPVLACTGLAVLPSALVRPTISTTAAPAAQAARIWRFTIAPAPTSRPRSGWSSSSTFNAGAFSHLASTTFC